MTFDEILDQVLAGAFDSSLRSAAQDWVNHRYQQLWGLESWAFKFSRVNVGVLAGSSDLQNPPLDLGAVDSLQNPDGDELLAIPDPRDFFRTYTSATSPQVGPPEAYCVIDGGIVVGPTADASSDDYLLVYEKQLTLLVNGTDEPAFPPGYHRALVHGAKAEGYSDRSMILFAGEAETMWEKSLASMRADLLVTIRDPGEAWSPRYRPESW